MRDGSEFEEIANRGVSYEAAINKFYPAAYSLFASVLERTLAKGKVETILDVGCGDGWTASFLSDLDSDLRYLGLDPAPSAIARLNQTTKDGRFHAMVGDSVSIRRHGNWPEAIQLLGSSPDLLICHASLHEISKNDDPIEFLRFVGRMTIPGGKILIGDYYYPAFLTDGEIESALRWIRERTGHDPSPPRDFLPRERVEALFDELGFQKEESYEQPANDEIALRYYLLLFSVSNDA